ncbi:MAG TPA: CU044_5270 family protein [Baekduia sp.]|uniref:CU044_5270 family protein n=1 Tax=Baekduia sp. TaxID=2600305 RepID=UPI002B99545C|nr:CU044_5270 family protein [Baekduia sp.]HMJ36847.1 CU044_5270 family protein [Baekduia sp.]
MSEDPDLTTLRAWTPPEPSPDAHAADRARARLLAHVAAAPLPAAPHPSRRRWWLVAAPPAVVVAVAVAVVLSLGSGVQEGSVAPAPATAAQALEQAAHAAERQPAPEVFPRPDQFFYTLTQATYLNCRLGQGGAGACVLATQRRAAWISQQRTGQTRTTVLGHRWPSPQERQKWIRLGRPSLTRATAQTFRLAPNHAYYLGNERLSYTKMRTFDQSGPALFRRLRDGVSHGQGSSLYGEVFTQIGDALREQPAPPKLRAALYRALKLVPGVRYLGPVKDALGRPALAVARTEDGTRRELLFDPATSAMLAEREVIVGPNARRGFTAPAGTTIADAVYEQRGVVDRIGEQP